VLKGALHLLCSGDTENVFQLMVYLVHPIGGGCRQSVQKCSRRSHVLAGPHEGGVWWPLLVYGRGDIPGPGLGVGEVDHYDTVCLERRLAVV
jgi:hypothetical protein